MRFTAELPLGVVEPAGEFQSMAALAEMTRALEAAQIDAAFVTDHPIPDAAWLEGGFGHDALDPFAGLAFVAAASTRLLLHTNIVVLPYRNPFLTAKGAATVQVMSGGRLILGVGPGYQKAEFEALGVDFHRRGKLMDEALEAIDRAWDGEVIEMTGSNFSVPGNQARPAPNPRPPIWIGGGSDRALARAARWGDGWCPFYATPGMSKVNQDAGVRSVGHLRELVARIAETRAKLGRTGPFDVVIGPRMRVKEPTSEAAQRYLDALGELGEAGVSWSTINIVHPSRAAWLELVQWFGEEVAARAR